MAPKATKKYATLHDLLILRLNSLYYTEQELVKALPKMAEAATNTDLAQAFADHADETKNHVTRLEEALASLKEKPQKIKVEAIDGLLADTDWCIKNITDPAALDAALIAAAQYVEHYEVAGYGAARQWAALMDHRKAADLLEQTLVEEEAADGNLNDLALGGINEQANATFNMAKGEE
jgi:ferritin-like metal-binding protein YciE